MLFAPVEEGMGVMEVFLVAGPISFSGLVICLMVQGAAILDKISEKV